MEVLWKDILAKQPHRASAEWDRKHPITIELLRSNVLHGEVLDLGCGLGTRTYLAQETGGARVTGIDSSLYALRVASRNFGLRFVCGDLLSMPFQANAFDNGYMLATIEHIVDTRKLLLEACRVIKPGGKLFVSVTDRNYHGHSTHVHTFTSSTLLEVLRRARLQLLTIRVRVHIIFALVEVPEGA